MDPCTFTSRDGLEIAYVDSGEGPPIVFVHGVLADHRQWCFNLPHFARRHRTVAIDLPGHGRSASPPDYPYTMGHHAAALLDLLDHLGLGRVVLVGNSMGGHVSLRTALDHPDRVSRLVLVDPAGAALDAPDRLMSALARRLTRFYRPWWNQVVARMVLRRNLDAPVVRAYIEDHLRMFRDPVSWRTRLHMFHRCLESVERHHLGGCGHRVGQPVLLFWGRSDLIIHRRYAHRLARELPDREVVLLGGVGHVPSLEVPDVFNRRVERFLARA